MKLATRRGRSALLAEDPQQEEEEVDEVQVEGEGAHDRGPPLGLARQPLLVDLLELLHVVRGERGEDQHARVRRDPIERLVRPEDVHDRRQDQADQRHEGDRADLGEVDVGDRAPDCERPEHPGRDQEGREDRLRRVELEEEGEGDADRRRVEQEEERRHPDRDPWQEEDEGQDQGQLGNHHPGHDSGSLGDVREQAVVRADQRRDAACDPEPDEHPEEDPLQEPGLGPGDLDGRLRCVFHTRHAIRRARR